MTQINNTLLIRVALCISIVMAIAGFLTDFYNTSKYGGVDLRDRVVGARVISELKVDPYFFKWNDSLSERYLDPNDNTSLPFYTRLTIPPTVLSLHVLFSNLSYIIQRYLWFFVQWISLLLSIYLLTKILTKEKTIKELIWIIGLLGISNSAFWRLHVERGQIYILYVFIFIISFYFYNRYINSANKYLLMISAVILGYLISLRPTFIFALIPFVIYKKNKFVSLALGALASSAILSSILLPLPLWKSYYNSVQLQSQLAMNENINYIPYTIEKSEGVDVKNFLSVPGEDSSLLRIFRGIFDTWFSSSELFLLLIVFFIPIVTFLLKFKKNTIQTQELFFIAVSLSLFSEFFLAAPRWPYANIIWLIPLTIMFGQIKKKALNLIFILSYSFALIGLLANIGLFLIPHFTLAGDAGIPFSILLYLIASHLDKPDYNINSSS